MKKMVRLIDLSFSYRTEDTVTPVLKQVNLEVGQGEFVCILGNSGCGKSTLLRMAAGFEEPESGTILIDGNEVSSPNMDRMMVFQEFDQLLPWKTVYENMVFPLRQRFPKMSRQELKAPVMEALSKTSMAGQADAYPHELSGGMKQRVALARALAVKPKVLLMDEPFASLDPHSRNNQQRLLLDLWKETGTTVLFVTHDVQEAVLLSDALYLMDEHADGRLTRYENELRRPRNKDSAEFNAFSSLIHAAYRTE